MKKLIILGGGLSGLSCAYHFPWKSSVYEARETLGGTASSMEWNGFIYDYGPHVSFTNDEYIKKLFEDTVNGEFFTRKVLSSNYYKGYWASHPALCNLCDLPLEINRDALISFVESKQIENRKPVNYQEWCELGQGKFFANNFTRTYTKKFWTLQPEELTCVWAGERISRPTLKQVINGSLGLQEESGHYFTEFRYPKLGGYSSYSNFCQKERDKIEINLNHKITQIDLQKKILYFDKQPEIHFEDTLVSSLPLPEFVRLCSNVPEEVYKSVNLLKCTSIALINIALNESPRIPYYWCYVYDQDIIFPRLTMYSNLSEFNSPSGCTALQVEIPYTDIFRLPKIDIIKKVIDDLASMKIIDPSSVLHAWQVDIKYGYVIYDFNRDKALKLIHAWMRNNGVEPVGRFGLWQYLWSDQAVKSGKTLIQLWV